MPLPPLIPDVLKDSQEGSGDGPAGSNTQVLEQLRASGAADLERAMNAARRIRDSDYSLRSFYDDVAAAFPELGWYMVQRRVPNAPPHANEPTTSNALPEDEYRRTIGAMFAVYWLARIGIDGERGFSFGVDESWAANALPAEASPSSVPFARMSALEKRLAFYLNTPWGKLEGLMLDAGVLCRDEMGEVRVAPGRMAALLVQTAIHDIMKVELIRPSVAAEHAPYMGFAAGDTIHDHDVALGYVLEHYGELLPSFQLVEPELQRAIRFTQAKIQFNNGWLVQAEAPPSATFSHFKACICGEAVDAQDIAFYFAHWLTDLAGAEPTPLRGSEKFTLKFPHHLSASFIDSFSVVEMLASHTETEVLERYLRQRWRDLPHPLGEEPRGPDAIPLMRLVVQAQKEAAQVGIYRAYGRMAETDAAVLRLEMPQTGLAQQVYSESDQLERLLPAILVYYSPALLQSLGATHADEALQILAEVYRQARAMWPAGSAASGQTVTIRIDAIKDATVEVIQGVYTHGEGWFLTRLNDLEGVVERRHLRAIQQSTAQPQVLLAFWRPRSAEGSAARLSCQ